MKFIKFFKENILGKSKSSIADFDHPIETTDSEDAEIILENFDENDPFVEYKRKVNTFTYLIGTIHKFNQIILAGENINKEYLSEIISLLSQTKKELLEIKETLGLPGGINFLENNHFDGFEIRDGIFIGNKDNVLAITSPWMKEFNPDNCYLYEVAHYIQYLAFSDVLYCGEELAIVNKKLTLREKITGGIKKWTTNLRSKLYALVPVVQADTF